MEFHPGRLAVFVCGGIVIVYTMSRVEFATEVMEGHDCYEVGFSDGEKIVCDGEHLWHIHDGLGWHTRPTDSLAEGFLYLLPQSYPHYNIRNIVSIKPVASVTDDGQFPSGSSRSEAIQKHPS